MWSLWPGCCMNSVKWTNKMIEQSVERLKFTSLCLLRFLTRRCEALDQGMCQLTRSNEAHTHPDDSSPAETQSHTSTRLLICQTLSSKQTCIAFRTYAVHAFTGNQSLSYNTFRTWRSWKTIINYKKTL